MGGADRLETMTLTVRNSEYFAVSAGRFRQAAEEVSGMAAGCSRDKPACWVPTSAAS
jgi:hypothetical protein